MKRKALLVLSVLIAFALLGGAIWAMQLGRTGVVRWDHPAWEKAYIEMEFDEPITPTLFVFSGTVRLRDESGAVLDSITVEVSGCEPQEDEPGSGQCGAAYNWSWETDNYLKGTITEEIKLSWVAPAYNPDIELVMPWVPSTCDLSGEGCTILFDQNTWTVSIPVTCENALAECGTWQDEEGWWFVSTFQGSKTWTWCLPGIGIGGPQ